MAIGKWLVGTFLECFSKYQVPGISLAVQERGVCMTFRRHVSMHFRAIIRNPDLKSYLLIHIPELKSCQMAPSLGKSGRGGAVNMAGSQCQTCKDVGRGGCRGKQVSNQSKLPG